MTSAELKELFLSGDESLIGLLGATDENEYNEYRPVNPNLISHSRIRQIFRTNGQLAHIKSLWFANIGRNGDIIHVKEALTEKTKERIQNSVKKVLNFDLDWENIKNQALEKVFEEGNAVIWFNSDKKPVVESIFKFNVYWDDLNKKPRYSYLKNGVEVNGLKNLEHGVDLWHIKDPLFSTRPVAPSRVNLIYLYLLLELYAVKANRNLFAKGMINVTLLDIDRKTAQVADSEIPKKDNPKGLTALQLKMKQLWDSVTGVFRSNQLHNISGLNKVFELGKNNTEMQFVDIIKDIIPEKICWAWNVTTADLGSGDNSTYNNTKTFSYVLHYKIGSLMEKQFDLCRNNFLLPKKQVNTLYGSLFYVAYQEPSNPDRLADMEANRKDWENNLLTENEYRELRGLEPVDDGDITKAQKDLLQSNFGQVGTENQNQNNNQEFKKKIEFKETLTEKALNDGKYKDFENKLDDSIHKQVKTFINEFKQSNPQNLENYTVKLPKITKYYSRKNFARDLIYFSGYGLAEVQKDKNIKFKKIKKYSSSFSGEYPEEILEAIKERSMYILSGGKLTANISELSDPLFEDGKKTYKGIDETTSSIISNYIKANATKGVLEIAKGLSDTVDKLSKRRAAVIASSEVANAVEGSRYIMYKKEYGTEAKSTWQTAGDELVGDDHEQNDGVTRKLGSKFPSGEVRPGERANCRCTSKVEPPDDY